MAPGDTNTCTRLGQAATDVHNAEVERGSDGRAKDSEGSDKLEKADLAEVGQLGLGRHMEWRGRGDNRGAGNGEGRTGNEDGTAAHGGTQQNREDSAAAGGAEMQAHTREQEVENLALDTARSQEGAGKAEHDVSGTGGRTASGGGGPAIDEGSGTLEERHAAEPQELSIKRRQGVLERGGEERRMAELTDQWP